jgi:hypothetical protein
VLHKAEDAARDSASRQAAADDSDDPTPVDEADHEDVHDAATAEA